MFLQLCLVDAIIDRRQDNFGGEGQGRNDRPGGERSVIWSVRYAAPQIIEKCAFYSPNVDRFRPGSLACRDSPAILSIAKEFARIFNRILSLAVLLIHESLLPCSYRGQPH